MPELAVVYMGTSSFACPALEALARHPQITVRAVVTQPDRPRGRRLQPQPPPVKELAIALGLSWSQPARAREPSFIEELKALQPDLIVVASYGQLLPQAILDLPRHGCLNLHASLLPKYRGAAPIQWALLNGDRETGVTLMKMDAGLDTGDMVAVRTTPIQPGDTALTLHDRLARIGAELLMETLPAYVTGRIQPVPQPQEGATYARKITREDGAICWSDDAARIARQVRALTPWPGTHTQWPDGDRPRLLKIWQARALDRAVEVKPGTVLLPEAGRLQVACGQGVIEVEEAQLEGGKRLPVAALLAGHPLREGDVLGG